MTNKIESIAERDAEALLQLFSTSGPFVTARTYSDYWLYARLFSSTCLCARDEETDEIAAALIAFKDQTPGSRDIYVQDVAVRVSARSQGLAKALLGHLIDSQADEGPARIWLTSEPDNVAAMRLWAQHGFVNHVTDTRIGDYWLTRDLKGPGKHRVVFERTVGSAGKRSPC